MEWTNEEVKYLELNYPLASRKELCSHLNRSFSSIVAKANRLSIQRNRKNTFDLDFNYFENIDSPSKAYILGIIWSDGCITSKSVLAISLIDKEILDFMKAEFKYTGEIKVYKRKNGKYNYSLRVCSSVFTNHLRNIGLHERKSRTIKFPRINKKYFKYFIAGLFDGDGYIHIPKSINLYKQYRKVGIAGNYELMETVQKILSKYGFPINKIQKNDKHSDTYRLIYVTKYVEMFWKKIYKDSPCKIKRKEQKFIDNEIVQNELLLRKKYGKNIQFLSYKNKP